MEKIIHSGDKFYLIDNGQEIAFLTYYMEEGKMVVDHTYVDDHYRGMGLAKDLVNAAVSFARGEGIKIIPVCHYVYNLFTKNNEYSDVWDKSSQKPVTCKL